MSDCSVIHAFRPLLVLNKLREERCRHRCMYETRDESQIILNYIKDRIVHIFINIRMASIQLPREIELTRETNCLIKKIIGALIKSDENERKNNNEWYT